MTLTLPARSPAVGAVRQAVTLPQPGFTERGLVVLTTFIFMHQTPNVWFTTRADLLLNSSNPAAVLLQLGLAGIAFARIAGGIDRLIVMFKLEAALFMFAGTIFLSVFWSSNPQETIKQGVLFLAVTIFGAYLVLRFSLDQIIRLLAVMFLISAVLNIAFIVAFPQFAIDSIGAYTGVFPQKNALGFISALAIPNLLIAGWAYRSGRLIAVIGALMHLGLLIGSQSKTMLVAGVVPTFLIAVYHLFRSRKTLRGAVAVSIGGSAFFTAAFATANVGLLAGWLDKDVSLTGRIPLWQSLWPVALERVWLGYGYKAAFGGFFSPVHEIWIQNRWDPNHAHNALLQIWLEIGLLGVVLFTVVYFRAVARAIKIVAIVPGSVGLWPIVFLTTTMLVSITESGMSSNRLGWTMFVVAVLSVSLHLKHRDQLGLSNDLRAATEANAAAKRGVRDDGFLPDDPVLFP